MAEKIEKENELVSVITYGVIFLVAIALLGPCGAIGFVAWYVFFKLRGVGGIRRSTSNVPIKRVDDQDDEDDLI